MVLYFGLLLLAGSTHSMNCSFFVNGDLYCSYFTLDKFDCSYLFAGKK